MPFGKELCPAVTGPVTIGATGTDDEELEMIERFVRDGAVARLSHPGAAR
ncbi:hypothetical protein [Krasilnikovia cinnamomea]|nr:hypothetical protein [Krasilnikovia cinnamomea]